MIILWPKESGDIGLSKRVLGDAIFMVTGFTWVCYNVLGKAMMQRYAPLSDNASAGIIGTLGIVPFAVAEFLSGQSPKFTLISVGGVIYAGHAAIMIYLQPLAGMLISWLMLHEQVIVGFIIGAVLVLGCVYLVMGKVPGKVKVQTHKTGFNA